MESLLDTVESLFAPDGKLATRQGFVYRPQQARMAAAVAAALVEERHLIVEAPTGVGKTLAYLIPSLLYALQEGRKALISTHTKNLQEQLLRKDFPIARSVIPTGPGVAALKGRRNYLCTTRLDHALGSATSLFDEQGREQLALIHAWSLQTSDGDVEGLGFSVRSDVWESVCSEQGICSGSVCGKRCFFQRAKLRAREAPVVILNHALFFSLLAINGGESHFIFPDDFVIFDEAQTLEDTAGLGVGLRLTLPHALQSVRKLYHPVTKKGLLQKRKRKSAGICSRAEQAALEFFTMTGQASSALGAGSGYRGTPRREVRIRTPRMVSDSIAGPFLELETHVREAEEEAEDMFHRQELQAARATVHSVRTGVESFLEQLDRTLTYWVELPAAPSGAAALCAAPSAIGATLGPRLFRPESPVIMTSATLSVNGSLGYFQQRIGCPHADLLVLDSPFDHSRQMTMSIARDIAEPETESYPQELPGWILRSIDRTHGKALVLFTSSHLMRSTAAAVRDALYERGLRLLVQGVDGQRHQLLEEFKRDIHSVLFGLDSFWMGVDVPGEALEHVIITRLPFAVPNHPIIEARLEQIAARGGNAFIEYTLPEAILKFKQGAGRLLRTSDDRGLVTILDSRIVRKSYGTAFLSSLPPCPVEIWTSDGELERIEPGDW